MTRAELLRIDLTRPHPRVSVGDVWVRFKPKDVEGVQLYIPSYVSWNGANRPGWQVRIDRMVGGPVKRFFSAKQSSACASLYEAWAFVVDNLLEGVLIPPDSRRIRVSVDTGVPGIWFGAAKPGDPRTLLLRVAQSTEADRAHNEIFYSLARDGTNPDHFLSCYRRAIAARRYYEHLRRTHYRLKQPITRDTLIPESYFPATVPVPDLLERALAKLSL